MGNRAMCCGVGRSELPACCLPDESNPMLPPEYRGARGFSRHAGPTSPVSPMMQTRPVLYRADEENQRWRPQQSAPSFDLSRSGNRLAFALGLLGTFTLGIGCAMLWDRGTGSATSSQIQNEMGSYLPRTSVSTTFISPGGQIWGDRPVQTTRAPSTTEQPAAAPTTTTAWLTMTTTAMPTTRTSTSTSTTAELPKFGRGDIKVNTDLLDKDGFCKARNDFKDCVLQHTEENSHMLKVSLFGNSYSGYYFWQDGEGLKEVFEHLHSEPGTTGAMNHKERKVKLSMHTRFDSGLINHLDSFDDIINEEDPDYVVLQDGSLKAFGWDSSLDQDGTTAESSHQAVRTANAMEHHFGVTLTKWAGRRGVHNSRKPTVILVAAWARPEEAFERANNDEPAVFEGVFDGSWGEKNYEVYKTGVSTHLKLDKVVQVHHEADMLEATLSGLSVYRERLFRKAAVLAGVPDSEEWRQGGCPFNVVIAPVGVAFHDIRVKVEDIFQGGSVPLPKRQWWLPNADSGSPYVVQPSSSPLYPPPTQASRKMIKATSEPQLFFTDVHKNQPWFGHPTPMGTFVYASMLKRTLWSVVQGKERGSLSTDIKLAYSSEAHDFMKNVILEEVNKFDVQAFNDRWRERTAGACAERPAMCGMN